MNIAEVDRRALEPHEQRYVELVKGHLRDVPSAIRVELLRDVRDHLNERPATVDGAALWSELGSPGAYADDLRRAHGLDGERTGPWARWIAFRLRTRVVTVTAVVLAAALGITGVVIARHHTVWPGADIENNGSGLPEYVGVASHAGISEQATAESRQYTVTYRSDHDVQMTVFLTSDRAVRLSRVTLAPSPNAVIKVVKTESAPAFGPRVPFTPFTPVTLSPDRPYMIRMTFRFQNCDGFTPNSYYTWESVHVTYSASGHTRSQPVKLYTLFAVKGPPPADCPVHS